MKFGTRLAGVLALTGAAVVAAVSLFSDSSPATAGQSSKTETLRIYEKTQSRQLTKADGRVLSGLIAEDEPKPGDTLDMVSDLYRGDHTDHGESTIGADHLRCEFVAAGPPKCVSNVVLGDSLLVVEGFPGRVTFGSGRYFGATGRVLSSKEVTDAPKSSLRHNDIDIVVQITRR